MAGAKQNWSVSDTNALLDVLKELKIVERLDGRKSRNSELFIQVHERLKEAGIDRTVEQIKNRWKSLKTAYYKAKNHNSRSGFDPSSFPFYRAIDKFMAARPLSNVPLFGVDVGFEDEVVDRCNTPVSQSLDATEDSISDESSSEAAEATEQMPTNGGDSSHPSSESIKKRKRSSSSGYAKAMCTWSTEQQAFMKKMQESQNRWVEEHQERRLQREERLVTRFIEESSRSNERLVGHLLDGLRTIIRPPPPPPVAPYSSQQHHYRNYVGSAEFGQNAQHYSNNYNSDYTLQDLS
ncbi:zinc finger protein with KRAB and SCAN domains 2 [Nothobranchius furzeri]|uniref:zinc finger protein with KRAB and SCAN domains 2 n=1 Tax=Nothobranchius furzeri TaxID=105023 RepID=UPI003904BBF8